MNFELPRLTIRPARADDSLCLSVLAMQVSLDTYATEGIRPAIAREVLTAYRSEVFAALLTEPQSAIEVAEYGGHLIGFNQLSFNAPQPLLPHAGACELFRLSVQEPFTGRGVGRAVLQSAECLATQRAAPVLWLTPWVHNHRALAFYAALGYEDHGAAVFCLEGEAHQNRVLAKQLAAGPAA